MAMTEMNYMSGGGSNVSYVPDTTKEITGSAITTAGGSWTATEDCVMVGTLAPASGWTAQIYLNTSTEDNDKNFVSTSNSGGAVYIGDNTNYLMGVFIAKGTKILARSYGTYNLKFYKPLYS